MKKRALFTMAVGEDRIYFDSVARYFPYNTKYFGQDYDVDYFLFTDREEKINGIINIPCKTTVWPYTTMLKNNLISDYLTENNKWEEYSHIFFIDADFAIGQKCNFFSYQFIFVEPVWNKNIAAGFFYGGETMYFKMLCDSYYDELQYIYENKLSLPRDLDEYYLGLFREQHKDLIHLIDMDQETNTLIFFDNENLDEIIKKVGTRVFMQPYKAEGRANKTMLIDSFYKEQECIVNLKEQYIFNNYTYDFGRLLRIDDINYRILWAKEPEKREVLNIESNRISDKVTLNKTNSSSIIISIVMPVYNTKAEYLKESIESVLNQTFTDFEFIIVDDGSTDTSCVELIESYKDHRIRLIKNKHDFIDSLNRGIKESKGRYIARMDSDDIMMPNRLQVQYDYMEAHPEVDVCGSWIKLIGTGTGKVESPIEHKEIITTMLLHNPIAHPTVMLRKETVLVEKKDLYKKGYNYAEDYKLWTDLVIQGFKISIIPVTLLYYRRSPNQITNQYIEEVYITSVKIRMEYVEEIMEKIVDQNDEYMSFFTSLIDLNNNNIITIDTVLNVGYHIYINYLATQYIKT